MQMDGEAVSARNEVRPQHVSVIRAIREDRTGLQGLVPQSRGGRRRPSRAAETVAAQGGGIVDATTGAVVPPIHLATTFVRDADNQYRRGFCYGRSDNATVRQ